MESAAKSSVRIGNSQGFWGDQLSAAATLLKQQPDLDYITLDYLAEVSLSIMAIQMAKDPNAGYAKDFAETLKTLIPFWQHGAKVKVVTNAGGLNPLACGKLCRELLDAAGCSHLKIGVVDGDDVLGLLKGHSSHPHFNNLDTAEPLEAIEKKLVTANAYLGAAPLVELLKNGAAIVITGRVADPSLTVAPCIAHHDWKLSDYDRIAQATVAGHLIECGTQATGGITTNWLELFASAEEAANCAFPFVEMASDGSFVITKPTSGGGKVDLQTVKEQLLYEIGDPDAYLSPDATVSFLGLQLKEVGENRVHVSGAQGKAPPQTYKVSATYSDGYRSEALLAVFGSEAEKKARRCGEVILQRIAAAGYVLERSRVECLGCGDVVGGVVAFLSEPTLECVLRICVADSRREALDCFAREIAPLVTSGPQGIAGYISGRPHIRPIFSYWPCLVERTQVHPRIQMV